MLFSNLNFRDKVLLFFAILLLLRLIFLGLALNDIPHTGVEGFWFPDGGDAGSYFKIAGDILNWDFSGPVNTIGFPLLLIPFLLLLSPQGIIGISLPILLLNGVFFYSVATIFVYFLSQAILDNAKKSLFISGVFLFLPYLFYFFFSLLGRGSNIIVDFTISRFLQLNFLSILSDPLSTVLVYGSLLLLIYLFKTDTNDPKLFTLLGFLTSFVVVTRLQNIIILPVYFLLILLWQRCRGLKWFVLGGLPLGLSQLYLNYVSAGAIYTFAYSLQKASGEAMLSFSYPLRLISYSLSYNFLILIVLLIIVAFVIYGSIRLYKSHQAKGLILSLFFYPNILFLLLLEPTLRNPRYFLPVLPIILIFAFIGFESLYKYVRTKISS